MGRDCTLEPPSPLAYRIADLIEGNAVQDMNFSYDDRFFVAGVHFAMLADMLRSGDLRARPFEPGEEQRISDVSPAGGRYDWMTDTLILGEGDDVMLVHEATHALQDRWALDDEAMIIEGLAYVTEWLYRIYTYSDRSEDRAYAASYYRDQLSVPSDNMSRLSLASVECILQTGLANSIRHVSLTRDDIRPVADRVGYLGVYLTTRGHSIALDGIGGCPR